jgi:hypothetical protein
MRWKRGLLFTECFSEFVDLATVGLTPLVRNESFVEVVKVQSMTCQERAWAAIMGVREFSYHEWFNYEHYWEGMQLLQTSLSRRPALKVLRTEHLHEDWGSVSTEALYRRVNQRRPSQVDLSEQRNGTSPTHHHHVPAGENSGLSTLSGIAFENLCRALCPEIQVYKRFLMAADNLNATQRIQSIQEIQRTCPQETPELRELCPDIPRFPPLKVPKRQYQTETKKRLFLPILPINQKNKKKTANGKPQIR